MSGGHKTVFKIDPPDLELMDHKVIKKHLPGCPLHVTWIGVTVHTGCRITLARFCSDSLKQWESLDLGALMYEYLVQVQDARSKRQIYSTTSID